MKSWKIGRWEDLFHPSNLPTACQTLPRLPSCLFHVIISSLLFNLTYVLAVLRPVPPTLSMLVCRLQ